MKIRTAGCARAAIAAVAIATSVTILPGPAVAQEPMEFDHPDAARFPPHTLVTRYGIDPTLLGGVRTSADLVAALREHLVVEAAMPLDEPLYVNLYARVASPRASNSYDFQSNGFAFALASGAAVSSQLASVVRSSQEAETFSDWDEDEAWTSLLEAIETGLSDPTSPLGWADALRERDDQGHVPIRIAAVHQVSQEDVWDLWETLERDYLEFGPRSSFGSSAMAGWKPPEDLEYDTQLLILELEPAPEVALPELTAVELPPEALDRFVGSYELPAPETFMDIRREGSVLVARVRGEGAEDLEPRLTPFSETEFWTEVEGDRITFTFNLTGDGEVESVTMEQPGFDLTMPRVP